MSVVDNIRKSSSGGGKPPGIINFVEPKAMGAYAPSTNYVGTHNVVFYAPVDGVISAQIQWCAEPQGTSRMRTTDEILINGVRKVSHEHFEDGAQVYAEVASISNEVLKAGDYISLNSSMTTLQGIWCKGGNVITYQFVPTEDAPYVECDAMITNNAPYAIHSKYQTIHVHNAHKLTIGSIRFSRVVSSDTFGITGYKEDGTVAFSYPVTGNATNLEFDLTDVVRIGMPYNAGTIYGCVAVLENVEIS